MLSLKLSWATWEHSSPPSSIPVGLPCPSLDQLPAQEQIHSLLITFSHLPAAVQHPWEQPEVVEYACDPSTEEEEMGDSL